MDERQLKQIFGQVLREARMTVGFSQERLALQIGLDRTYISLLERGLRQPSLSTIFRLSAALELSSAEMVARVQDKVV